MKSNNVIIFTKQNIVQEKEDSAVARAKSFKITTSSQNFPQYVRTVKAYASAGMPFHHIANAGDVLGDSVERGEIDAPLQNSWQGKVREIAEDENKILAWQNRGETVSINHQLSSPSKGINKEMVSITNSLVTIQNTQQQTLNVLEGINVLKEEKIPIPERNPYQALENNPYLKALPPDFKKAA